MYKISKTYKRENKMRDLMEFFKWLLIGICYGVIFLSLVYGGYKVGGYLWGLTICENTSPQPTPACTYILQDKLEDVWVHHQETGEMIFASEAVILGDRVVITEPLESRGSYGLCHTFITPKKR